jgi:predicted nucleic acid-binding protein
MATRLSARIVSLDTNVLVYSELEPNSEKGERARRLIGASAFGGVLAVQVLLEFIAVVRRKRPDRQEAAVESYEAWSHAFHLLPTTPDIARAAVALSRKHGFQVWDAVIWSAAKQAGATLFFSEDLQDGLTIDGMTAVNPFAMSEAGFAELLSD